MKLFQGWKGPPQIQQYTTQRRWIFFWKPRKRKHFYSRRLRVYFKIRKIFEKLGFCEPLHFTWRELPAKVLINAAAVRITKKK